MSEWKEEFKAYVESLNLPRDDYKGIIEYIEDAPTVDAEPVIRCRDCELFYKNRSPFSSCCSSGKENGYCFWAERREE